MKSRSAKPVRNVRAVRHRKIKSLKNKILNGRYRVSNAHLARALFLSR